MSKFLNILRVWFAKLAFWRKHAVDTPEASTVEPTDPAPATTEAEAPTSAQPAVKPGWLIRLKSLFVRLTQWLTFRRKPVQAAAEPDQEAAAEPKPKSREEEAPEIPERKLGFFARLKQWLIVRRKPAQTESDPDAVAGTETRTEASDEPEVPEFKPSFLARLKRLLNFRRKPAEGEGEAGADDKTQVIEQPALRSATAGAEDEEEAPPPSRFKRLLLRLRRKWIWIPALSLIIVGLVSWGVLVTMHATQEKNRLQAELKAAKAKLEEKQVAQEQPASPQPTVSVESAPAETPPAEPTPAEPEKKIDPAFKIVGHIPAPQPEEASGVNASDCVVKDKQSVAENLKDCISSFNEAAASTPKKPKKP